MDAGTQQELAAADVAAASSHPGSLKSWRGLFANTTKSELKYYAPQSVEGEKVVRLPSDALENGKKQWEQSLVGRFVGDAPDMKLVVALVNKLWGKRSKVVVSRKGVWFVFQFENQNLLNWVLESSRWYLGRRLLILQKWSPDLTGSKQRWDKIPIWVILRNIPMHLYSNTCISYIASAIGKPLYMDKATTTQTHLDFARVCIEVNAGDEIEKSIRVDIGEEELVEVEVIMPWCPERCQKCKQFGHNCDLKQREEEQKDPILEGCKDAENSSSSTGTTESSSEEDTSSPTGLPDTQNDPVVTTDKDNSKRISMTAKEVVAGRQAEEEKDNSPSVNEGKPSEEIQLEVLLDQSGKPKNQKGKEASTSAPKEKSKGSKKKGKSKGHPALSLHP